MHAQGGPIQGPIGPPKVCSHMFAACDCVCLTFKKTRRVLFSLSFFCFLAWHSFNFGLSRPLRKANTKRRWRLWWRARSLLRSWTRSCEPFIGSTRRCRCCARSGSCARCSPCPRCCAPRPTLPPLPLPPSSPSRRLFAATLRPPQCECSASFLSVFCFSLSHVGFGFSFCSFSDMRCFIRVNKDASLSRKLTIEQPQG